MGSLADELEKLISKITKTELRNNYEVRQKCSEIKELVRCIRTYELSNSSPMLNFINANVLLEN